MQMLRKTIKWKNLCIIFSIIFLIIGFFVGKSFGADIVQGYNIPYATPYIPGHKEVIIDTNQKFYVSQSPTVKSHRYYDFFTQQYKDILIQYYDLNTTYVSDFTGFVRFTISYMNGAELKTSEITHPVNIGVNNIVWKEYFANISPDIPIQCVKIEKLK